MGSNELLNILFGQKLQVYRKPADGEKARKCA